MSTREIYEKTIRQLPAMDRLRLATMILDDLTESKGAGLDISDEWSDEDIADLTAFAMKRADQTVSDEENNG